MKILSMFGEIVINNLWAKMKRRTMLYWLVAAFVVSCGGGEAVAQTDFWQKIHGPFGDTVNALAINSFSGHIFVGTRAGVFRSTDDGVNWTESNSGLNNGVYYFVINSIGTILAESDGWFRSTDDGSNWNKISSSFPSGKAFAFNDSGYIFTGWGNEVGGGIERSTDNGASWISAVGVSNTYAFAISDSGTIFAGGWKPNGACVFRSTDNGSSWTNTGSVGVYYPVSALAISPAGHIFAGTASDGVFHSTDNGAHWIQCNTGIMRTAGVYHVVVNASGHIFADGAGLSRSTDDGANWTTVNSGLANYTVLSLTINASGTIYAGTQGGLFRSVQSTTSVRELSDDAPMSFSLDQNYPNPFNPTTNISFSLLSRSFVSLKVFDALGREVLVLVSEELPAGTYTRQWNASDLPSGVYFYRFQTDKFTETKKLVLLK